ncbi:MAG: DUF2283 domain-containing protein [Candidatus Pacearchaeota archaeon]
MEISYDKEADAIYIKFREENLRRTKRLMILQ